MATPYEKIYDRFSQKITDFNICDLDDYSFISQMHNLEQLYIYVGENLDNISFVTELKNLRQIYIAESHIESITPLADLLYKQKAIQDTLEGIRWFTYGMEAICIRSTCNLDGEVLLEPHLYMTEVWVNNKRIRKTRR